MKPKLNILPAAQLQLWPQLSSIPHHFILYGGTAIALQIGHRQSVDFDFFSALPLDRDQLFLSAKFLDHAICSQPELNTLNCQIPYGDEAVKLQFLAGLAERQGRVEDSLICDDNKIRIASLRDLFATKLNTIQMRAEIKDYIDIDALILHGLKLEDGLGCARAIYGKHFDPATSLRALCSYRDGDLPQLNPQTRERLIKVASEVNDIPDVNAIGRMIS